MSLKRLGKSIKKAVKFEKSHTKNLIKGIKDDPKRLFLGVDPFSTKVWNKALGRDDRALVNQLGGATSYDYQVALDEGIDIGPGKALHDVAGVVAGAYAGGALGQAAGAGASAVPGVTVTPATQTAITTGAKMAVPAATAALEEPLEVEEEEPIGLGGLGSLQVYNVPTYRRAKGGYASPAQARLMRATAHGWKKPGGGGPSRAVAQEFVDAKDRNMYSGGFAENRYWTGGLAAMNEINSGVPQTLNFQEGGSVWGTDPIKIDQGNFKSIMSIGPMRAEGWQWDAETSTMYPPLWNIEAGGLEQTILQSNTAPTTTAPATTGIGTPYVGSSWGSWGGSGATVDPTTTEAVQPRIIPRIIQSVIGGDAQSQWTPEQIAAWEQEQRDASRQSSYRDQLREHKANVAATLNPVAQQISTPGFSTGGGVDMEKPKGFQFGGGFTLSDEQLRVLRERYSGVQQPTTTTATTNPTPAELHEWWLENPGVPYPGSGQVARTSAPVTMTSTAPYKPSTPAEMIALPGRDAIPLGQEVDMSGYKSSGIAGILKGMTEKALAEKGYYEGANNIWYPPESTIAGSGGTGAVGTLTGETRNIPGAATSTPGIPAPGTGAGAPTTSKWTPEQVARWQAKQTSASRQSSHREKLREHKKSAASLLNPKTPPRMISLPGTGIQPPQYGDAPEPGMMYPGGTPGFYAPGGPGYGGGSFDLEGNYTAGAEGGYMNYQEGGAARPTPVEGGGAPIAGHQEGTNPFNPTTHPSSYRQWERKYHIDPPPPPPPPEPEEEPGWWASLFSTPDIKTRTERELAELGEARGGPVRRYQVGGLARVAPPAGGVPPWVESAGYMEPEGYQFGGSAIGRTAPSGGFFGNVRRQPGYQQRTLGRSAPSRIAPQRAPQRIAPPQQRTLASRTPRWTPQQQTAWRGAAGNPALRSAMSQQQRQHQALMNRGAPPVGGRVAQMQADQQRQFAAQRGAAGQQQSLASRLGGNRFGEDYRRATGRQTYQDVVNRGGGGINPRLPGGGRMYGSAPQPGMAYAGGTPGFYGPGGPGRGPSIGGGGGIIGGARVPPNMRGFLQKQRMMNRPPSNVGGGVNRVGQQDQQGALSRAMQRGTGRRPMSRRGGFPGRGGVR